MVDAPWYAFRILWLLEVFQVIAIFGDYETFHIPLWGNSGATAANMLVLIAGFSALAIMLKFFGAKKPITLITVAIIGVSWPLAISQLYSFYLWAVFLSFLVAFACSGMVDAPWYAFRIVWLLELFQVMAIFGD